MKNNADKVIREKLGVIDTLESGIVYGKEEAWDKLQARMDHKPAKRIALKYFVAAAAVVLVLISVMGVYYHPAKQAVVNVTNDENKKPANIIAATQPAGNNEQKVIVSGNRVAAGNAYKHLQPGLHTDVPPLAMPAPSEVPVIDKNVPPVATAPLSVPHKKMRVVYINELGNEEESAPAAVATSRAAAIDVRKLPVVQINEVIHDEYEVQQLRKENRFSDTHHMLLHQRTDLLTEREDNSTQYQPFYKQRYRID